MIGFAMFSDDGPDGGIVFGIGVGAEFGVEVTGLKDAVGFMVAKAGIDGANEGEVVHHGGLFGEVFADGDPWDLGFDGLKRAAVIEGAIGFRVPGIDMAWSTGHPEEDDAFGRLGGLLLGEGRMLMLQPSREGKASESVEAGFEHIAAGGDEESFSDVWREVEESVAGDGMCGVR